MSRRLVTCVSLLLTIVGATLRAAPSPPPRTEAAKPPWLWTIEERIAKRVSPAERELRRARDVQRSAVAPGWSPIDGRIEPELFLPVELVTRLVLNTDADPRRREVYRAPIVSHGWDYDQFWAVLQAAGAPYLEAMQHSKTGSREARERADSNEVRRQICVASARLLEAAYEAFGAQQFDEFLYRSVAPPIRTSIADHANTADVLRNKARGCR